MAQVTAQLNGLRLAPRKVRAVVNLIKKRNVQQAIDQLHYMVRRPAPQLLKLLNSAVANAEHTYQMVPDNLFIKELVVNEGIKLKRYMPRAQGRATEIQKKMSSVKLVLGEKVPGLKREKKTVVEQKVEQKEEKKDLETLQTKGEEMKPSSRGHSQVEGKPEVKREVGKKGLFGAIRKKVFSRKVV